MGNIHVHSQLLGPLHESNPQADWLKHFVVCWIQEAAKDHTLHHQNATALRLQLHIPPETADSTGIPYKPPRQAIVRHSHQVLKSQLHKLQQEEYKYSFPLYILNYALYLIILL